jgi:hypothetical protein
VLVRERASRGQATEDAQLICSQASPLGSLPDRMRLMLGRVEWQGVEGGWPVVVDACVAEHDPLS